jgi:hypothetical protein
VIGWRASLGGTGGSTVPTQVCCIGVFMQGRAGTPVLHFDSYDFPATARLFFTLKAPKTWLALIPAICLSIAVPTTP